MRNLFTKKVTEGRVTSVTSYKSLALDSIEFRDLTRSSVLYLSAFLTAGGFLNIIRRGEPHIEMWLSLIFSTLALFAVWQIRSTSRHTMVSLHILMLIMVFNINVQVVHGIHYQLMCTLPFYLIWIGLLPTFVVAAGAVAITALTIFLASGHVLIPENMMLAIASGLVVHFAKVQVHRQTQLASSDVLTGALNRRYLLTQLNARRADFTRHQLRSSLVLFDIDGLKEINDRFGHRFGDDTLKYVVKTIQQRVRASDALFRIGGDEFALILVGAKAHAALNVANEIRGLIRDSKPSELPDFSISFGVCDVDDSSSPEDWLDAADEALYVAKNKGGDTARLAS